MQIWQVRLVSMVVISWQLRQFEHMDPQRQIRTSSDFFEIRFSFSISARCVWCTCGPQDEPNLQTVRTTKTVKRTSSVADNIDLSSSITYKGC